MSSIYVCRYTECRLQSICTFADVSFYYTIKYALYSFQLLVTCTHVELLLIYAICMVPQDYMFCQILSTYSYAT